MATAQQPQSRTVQAAPSADPPAPSTEKGILDMILEQAPRIQSFLPEKEQNEAGMKRVASAFHLNVKGDKTGALKKCLDTPEGRESVIQGLARIAQWGLEIGTQAYLLPFNTKVGQDAQGRAKFAFLATPTIDYKTIGQLMVASGSLRTPPECRVVREGDDFPPYEYGLAPKLIHRPNAKSTAPITHAYIILRMRGGAEYFEVMSREEIDAHRAKYSKQWNVEKVPELPAWYAKKTMLRLGTKYIPQSPKMARLMAMLQQDRAYEEHPSEMLEGVLAATEERRAADDESSPLAKPGDGEPEVSDEEAAAYWDQQDERSARAGR